jgi:two-component system nitrate/nitrite response regulator NarL
MVLSEQLTEVLALSFRNERKQQGPDLASLTRRELQIVKYIAEGMSNKQIGRKLDIAESTVKVHVKHLLKKLGLRSRVEAAVWMVEQQK